LTEEITHAEAELKDGMTECLCDGKPGDSSCDGFDETKRRDGKLVCFYYCAHRPIKNYCSNAKIQCWAARKAKR